MAVIEVAVIEVTVIEVAVIEVAVIEVAVIEVTVIAVWGKASSCIILLLHTCPRLTLLQLSQVPMHLSGGKASSKYSNSITRRH